MDDLEPAALRMWIVSSAVELVAVALVMLGYVVDGSWRLILPGVGAVLFGGDLVYTRRMRMLSSRPGDRDRVRLPAWHHWVVGVVLIATGGVLLFQRLLR
jgi:hypothetical protein